MKQIIDIENWERKENFNFFRHFQNPQLSITSEVECGGAKQRAKAAGQSFFLHYPNLSYLLFLQRSSPMLHEKALHSH